MVSKVRFWIRRYMPNLYNFQDERVKVDVRMGGMRRCTLLRWFPYLTSGIPKLFIEVHLKDTKFQVKTIEIVCDAPKHREDSLFDYNYGWIADKALLDNVYEIRLPKLDRSGNYEYRVNVIMTSDNVNQQQINSAGKIFTTGKVFDEGTTILNLLYIVVGGILGALIEKFIIR